MKKIIVLVFMCILALAGCSSDSSTDDSKVTLRFAPSGNEVTMENLRVLVEKYNSDNPNVEVIFEEIPGKDFDTKMTAAMGAGDAPDIMMMWNYPMFKDGLQPLNQFVESDSDFDLSKFYETTINYSSIGEDIYGIPIGYTSRVIFYNKDLYDEAGLEYPQAGWTLAQYYENARIIKEKTGDPGIVFPVAQAAYPMESYLWNSGISWMVGDKLVPNQDEVVKIFSDWQNLIKEGIAITDSEVGRDAFATGKVGMFDSGIWPKTMFDETGLNYGIVELPVGIDMAPVSAIHSSSFAMSANTEYPEESWDFIKYLTSEEAAKSRIETELPVYEAVAKEYGMLDDEYFAPFFTQARNSSDYQTSSFKSEQWPEFQVDMKQAAEKILSPEMMENPQQVLDELATKYQ